jgi:hypothetical protein
VRREEVAEHGRGAARGRRRVQLGIQVALAPLAAAEQRMVGARQQDDRLVRRCVPAGAPERSAQRGRAACSLTVCALLLPREACPAPAHQAGQEGDAA